VIYYKQYKQSVFFGPGRRVPKSHSTVVVVVVVVVRISSLRVQKPLS